jgi:hypothetical protein
MMSIRRFSSGAKGGLRKELIIHSRIELEVKAQNLPFPLDWVRGQRYLFPPTKSDVVQTGPSAISFR